MFSGGQNALHPVGVRHRVRVGNGAGSDARMHSSLAVEKNWNSESMAYKDVRLS